MIKAEKWCQQYPIYLSMGDWLSAADTLKEKTALAIEAVKGMPIKGCITGSCLLPGFDPDLWGTTPDIDIFVYSKDELKKALVYAENVFMMTPGTGDERSEKQERWKLQQLMENGINYKTGITTYKFHQDGIILNFTFKQEKFEGRNVPLTSAPAVLMSFDMSIVMQAYDIQKHVLIDMRPEDVPVTTAVPNPLRNHNCVMWSVAKWIRQFDRVVKYYSRGYDTRPMARFYLEMIDNCIDQGYLFDSDANHNMVDSYLEEFIAKREQIASWLKEHEED